MQKRRHTDRDRQADGQTDRQRRTSRQIWTDRHTETNGQSPISI